MVEEERERGISSGDQFSMLSTCLRRPCFGILTQGTNLILRFNAMVVSNICKVARRFYGLQAIISTRAGRNRGTRFHVRRLTFARRSTFFKLRRIVRFVSGVKRGIRRNDVGIVVRFLRSNIRRLTKARRLRRLFRLPNESFLISRPPMNVRPISVGKTRVRRATRVLLLSII